MSNCGTPGSVLRAIFSSETIQLPQIVLLGDSLTQRSFDPNSGCWGAHLANKFQRIADVLPRGFSGYNTRWFRARLPSILGGLNPGQVACVLLWLGANDANEPNSCTGQHVPIDEYSTNLKHILQYLEESGIQKSRLILATPPPYVHERFAATCVLGEVPSKSQELTEKYARECAKVAQYSGVTLVDIHQSIKSQSNYDQYLEDGLHFNRAGGEYIYKVLEPFIVSKFEQFSGEKFDPNHYMLPYWKDIASPGSS